MSHERERCFCGAMSLTISGYCVEHRDRETYRAPEQASDERVDRLQRQLSDVNARLRAAEKELIEWRNKARENRKLLMLVAIGDIKVDEITDIVRARKEAAQ
jgi:hypothetical protein